MDILVVWGGYNLINGRLAVQSFYIISGFYMSLILNEKYNNKYLFYTNRALRLYPIYWVILILSFLFSMMVNYPNNTINFYTDNILTSETYIFLIFTNIFMIGQDLVMFMGLDSLGNIFLTPNFRSVDIPLYRFLFVGQAWTLGLEILFYILAPFLVRKNIKFLLIISFFSLLIRFYIYIPLGYFNQDPWSYRFFPNELVLFILGIIAYKIYNKYKNKNININIFYMINIYIMMFTLMYQFIPILGMIKYIMYLISVFLVLPFLFIYSKYKKIDRHIGDLSYIIYISHLLIINIISSDEYLFDNLKSMGILSIVVVIITILFSIILLYIVQKPIDKIRWRRLKF